MASLTDQTRLVSRAARRTAERARRKRTKAWTSPIDDGEAPTSSPKVSSKADAAFIGMLPGLGPPVVDFLALADSSGDDAPDKYHGNEENRSPKIKFQVGPTTPALGHSGNRQFKKMPDKSTPAPQHNGKRRAQTPLSQRSVFDSEAGATPGNESRGDSRSPLDDHASIPMRSMLSPMDSSMADSSTKTMHRSPEPDLAPKEEPSDAVNTDKYDSESSKAPGISPSSRVSKEKHNTVRGKKDQLTGDGAKNTGSPPRNHKLKQSSNRTYGNFYSPATFLRMRPYGATYRVDRGTAGGRRSSATLERRRHRNNKKKTGNSKRQVKSPEDSSLHESLTATGAATSDSSAIKTNERHHYDTTSGAESEWVPGATSQCEDTADDFWEADGDSNDETGNEQSEYDHYDDNDGEGFVTDVSVKSGRWCRKVHEAMEREGLTPKAPAMRGARPGHLRYVQSYAEVSLAGESEMSEFLPTPSKEEEDQEENEEESDGLSDNQPSAAQKAKQASKPAAKKRNETKQKRSKDRVTTQNIRRNNRKQGTKKGKAKPILSPSSPSIPETKSDNSSDSDE